MAAHRLDFTRMPMTEYGEMDDAYGARKCDAEVGEIGDLAVARRSGAGKGAKSRILPEPLATFPVFAVTPASDPQWAAIVAWAIVALERAELPAGPWTAGGWESAAVKGEDLGLTDDWTKRVARGRGILCRHLRPQSRRPLAPQPAARPERPGRGRRPVRHAVPGVAGQGDGSGVGRRTRLKSSPPRSPRNTKLRVSSCPLW